MKKPLFLAVFLLTFYASFAQIANNVIISEVYASATSSATITRDYIELYNPTSQEIDIAGWKVKYKSATGTTASSSGTIPADTKIKAYGYYLVGLAGTGTAASGVTFDLIVNGVDLSSSSTGGGHAALTKADSGEPVWGGVPVDIVGWGTANLPEGSTSAVPITGTVIERKACKAATAASTASGGLHYQLGNGYDSNNNSVDFYRVTPNPQNSASSLEMPPPPPVFIAGYPNSSAITINSLTLNSQLNHIGKTYYVVLPNNATAPSPRQVKLAKNANDNAVALSGTISHTTASTTYNTNVMGLAAATAYDIYLVGEDDDNLQSTVTKLEVTTENVLPVTLTSYSIKSNAPGQLEVNWSTASEIDNNHFELIISTDGQMFQKLISVNSKGTNGKSDTPLNYNVNLSVNDFMRTHSLAGFGLLALLLMPAFRNRALRLFVIALMILSIAACEKKEMEKESMVYVKLMQVDHNGFTTELGIKATKVRAVE